MKKRTHFDYPVDGLMWEYVDDIGLEEGDVYSEDEYDTSMEEWLTDYGFVLNESGGFIIHEETQINVPDIIDVPPMRVCKQLEKHLQNYLELIYERRQSFLEFTFEFYLDTILDVPFDIRKINDETSSSEYDAYYFLVDDFGEEIVD